jgi:SpoVK/Ycf46/Vps4 family AAA+-type ATPase
MTTPHLSEISTDKSWSDLALTDDTARKVEEIKKWLRQSTLINRENEKKKKLRQGYRALFHGPPSTGKTLTAALVGKEFDMPVYRIDLSMVVSKYIGETEKNLATIFDRANEKGGILLFDEADALFGKRTDIKDAHDRFTNQDVSYLLQRIEDYNGLVILATNMKSNVDEAFIRRFHLVVHFPIPDPE